MTTTPLQHSLLQHELPPPHKHGHGSSLPRRRTHGRHLGILGAAMALMTTSMLLPAAEYYVAGNGSDSRTAAQAQNIATPWKTIQKAATTMVAGDTCWIRAGTYRETVTVASSGTAVAPIRFSAYQNEVVTISGTEPVTANWTLETNFGSGHVYAAPMNWSLGGQNQIFVGGVMKPEGQWPNPGQEYITYPWRNSFHTPSKDWSYADTAGYDDAGQNGWISDAALPDKPNGYWVGSRLMIMSGKGWYMEEAQVTAYANGTKTLTTNHVGNSLNAYRDLHSGNEFYLIGAKEELDMPGEWYYEAATQKLFIYTASGLPTGVEAKKREYGFILSGRSFIQLDGLRFFGTTIQTTSSSSNLDFNGLTMSYLYHNTSSNATVGLALTGNGHILRNSSLINASGALVSIVGNDVKVVNNLLQGGSYIPIYDYSGSGAYTKGLLDMSKSTRALVSHNTISRAGRVGIYVAGANSPIFEYNDINDAMRLATDGGAIYTGIYSWPVLFHHNLIHEVTGAAGHWNSAPEQGLYCDVLSSNWMIHHNIFWDISGFALMFNHRQNFNFVFNNTVVGTGAALYSSFALADNAGSKVFNNVLIGSVASRPLNTDYSGNAYDNPGFVDISNADFRLTAGSSAIDSGLEIAGITDGYQGAAPDLGALEWGGEDWTLSCGHDFSVPVTAAACVYAFPNLPGNNRVSNSGFEDGVTSPWTLTGNATLGGNYSAFSNSRSRSGNRAMQCGAGISKITQTISVLPGRVYRFSVGATGENASVAGATLRFGVSYVTPEIVGKLGDRRADVVPYNVGNATGNDWYMNALYFRTGGNTTSVHIWISVDNTTTDKVYLDDIAVLLDEGYETQSDFQTLDWPLNEWGGTTAYDYSGSGWDGVLYNGPIWQTGTIGGALNFNGVNQHVVSPSIPDTTETVTVACWAKSDTANWNQSECFVSKPSAFVFGPVKDTKKVTIQVYLNGAWRCRTFTPPTGFDIQQWHHYTGYYDSAAYWNGPIILVDGQVPLDSVYSIGGTSRAASGAPVYVGRDWDTSSYFDGSIDDVRIWTRALLPCEIADLVGRAAVY